MKFEGKTVGGVKEAPTQERILGTISNEPSVWFGFLSFRELWAYRTLVVIMQAREREPVEEKEAEPVG